MIGKPKQETCYQETFGQHRLPKRRSGTLINRLVETLFSTLFHTASALSAPSGHLPLEGKADDTREACYQETFGHRPIYAPRRFHIFMRRTNPVEPFEPIEPAEPLSSPIKGQHAPWANLKPKEPQKCGAFLWLFDFLSNTRAQLRVYSWSFLCRKVPSFQTCPGPGSRRSKRYGSVHKRLCP